MKFPIQPGPQASPTLVLAFRIWLTPYAAEFIPNAGGFHTAPLLGSTAAVAAVHQIQWLQTIRVYGGKPLEALLFFLLSIVASSLILFDRTDRVYLWIGAVFFLTALLQVLVVIGAMTQFIAGRKELLFEDTFVLPLLLSGWVMVWWVWFRLDRPAWLPKAVADTELPANIGRLVSGLILPERRDDLFFRMTLPWHLDSFWFAFPRVSTANIPPLSTGPAFRFWVTACAK